MTERENALRTIRFDDPERITSGYPCHGLTYQGCNHEGYEGGGHDCPVGSVWTDIWGTTWHKEHAEVMGFPRGNPLSEPSKMKEYIWPDPNDERICGKIYELAAQPRQEGAFLSGQHRDTLWEKAYMLVGMENMMIYLHTEPGFARDVLHHITDFQIGIARHYLGLGVEHIGAGDDLGTQCAPLLSPETVNEFFVPEYHRLFDLYSEKRIIINFHSCGHIEEFVDTFVGLGINVLNPIQATANDLERVRALSQGKLALQGGVSTGVIMEGPVDRIVDEVRMRMWQLGRDGGYFCGPDQGMPFPQDHIDAVYETIDRFGRYPIEDPLTWSTEV